MSSRKKILITGASGYIGKHVVQYFLNYHPEYYIIELARDISADKVGSISTIQYDILENAKSENLYTDLQSPDICIHLAWENGFQHNHHSHLDNLSSHYHFIENLINHGCENISVIGSMHEIGYHEGGIDEKTPCEPLSLYGIAKNGLRQACFALIKDKSVSFKWLRAFYITGDDLLNHSIFSRIMQWENENKLTFPFTDGTNKYDYIDVDKLAKFICIATIQTEYNGIINVCSGEPISLKDKVDEFLSIHNLKIRPEYGAFPNRPYDSPSLWGDNQIITEILENYDKKNY